MDLSFEGQPLGVLCRVEMTENEEHSQEAMQAASLAALTVHNGHRYVNAGRASKTLPKATHLFHQWILRVYTMHQNCLDIRNAS